MVYDPFNIQKSVTFLYTKNKLPENEIRKIISLTIASKRIKCLGISLSKKMKYLYTENYKNTDEEIEEDTSKWKDFQCSWIGRFNIVKCSYYPKLSTD